MPEDLVSSVSLSYVVENMPTCMTYTPSQGYHFKKWKAKQALYDAAKFNTPCRDNNDKYYGIQHGLKKVFDPHGNISHICGPRKMQKYKQTKHGLIWVYFQLWVEHLLMDI